MVMGTAPDCRVFLVDGQTMFREGLSALLRDAPGIQVVGDADDVGVALDRVRLLRANIVVLDNSLPFRGETAAVTALREIPDVRVIVLGATDDPRLVYEAIRTGATGYVPKTHGASELIGAIRLVARGQAALPAPSLTRLVDFIVAAPSAPAARTRNEDELSEREQEVLALVARGLPNREIAETLCIAESTVRSHLHHILGKLNLANRVQAAAFALGHGARGRAGQLLAAG